MSRRFAEHPNSNSESLDSIASRALTLAPRVLRSMSRLDSLAPASSPGRVTHLCRTAFRWLHSQLAPFASRRPSSNQLSAINQQLPAIRRQRPKQGASGLEKFSLGCEPIYGRAQVAYVKRLCQHHVHIHTLIGITNFRRKLRR
jgi:hypothetical protein